MNPNPAYDPTAVPPPASDALAFHRGLPGYAPTPLRDLAPGVRVKDESLRLGLPAFKILGASWAVEQALRRAPGTHTLVAASAGNHGRAVARSAAQRGLRCRIFLPARVLPGRRDAIAAEGAEALVLDGDYEAVVAAAEAAAAEPGVLLLTDVGTAPSAHDVIDGYATLFAEIADQAGAFDDLLVPVGVGSLAAAAARFGAHQGVRVIGVEPEQAACLTASLAAGAPARVRTPGTIMAGMDCAEVSAAAWPTLAAGIAGTVTVPDAAIAAATERLAAIGMEAGECGAAVVAALDGLDAPGRTVVVATEGRTRR